MGDFLHCSTPLKKATIVLWYAISIVRVLVLMLIEFVLAFLDFVRGMIQGRDLIKELKFVPTRVFISILARELNTIGACLDATRGLPIIHLNYLGYDEQAHRRGPSSTFAHWSLKGIDFAIKKVWCTAQRSPRRQYDVWVYSDHGQESTIPYPVKHSKSLQQAVGELFDEFPSIKNCLLYTSPSPRDPL
mgnify:FL=1